MTGHIRCGMSLNGAISTTFGSTRISFTMSGRCRYMIDMMIVLMQTDLPEPVVPAIRQWGICGQVGDQRLAAGVLAEEQRDRHLAHRVGRELHQLLEADFFLLLVGHFDADRVLAGDRRDDADGLGLQGALDVVGQRA